MDQWLEWARGPAFRFALAVLLLGVLRLILLNIIGLVSLTRHARERRIPMKTVVRETVRWLFPFSRVENRQLFFTTASALFHISVIVVPVFLGAHILLWQRGFGIGWIALDQGWADALTIVAIVTAVVLFVRRVSTRFARSLSRVQDYALPVLILTPFVTGYLAMHPGINPFSYDPTMLVHVLSGNLVLIAIPFTKLSHAVLFPASQLVSEMGWYLAPGAGSKVSFALGKEGERI